MKKGDNKERKGFTVIEVALVLAIAGLIFLMVFVALPGLRASQRDTDRREDMLTLIDHVKEYQNNNRGALPTSNLSPTNTKVVAAWDEHWTDDSRPDADSWAGFYYDYFNSKIFEDPIGERYTLIVQNCGVDEVDLGCTAEGLAGLPDTFSSNIYVVLQATCKGSTAIKTANPRKIAVLYRLERAGVYCANS